MGYNGTFIKKIVPLFKIIAGDFNGKGGASIYGDYFSDEDTTGRNRVYSVGM